MFCARESAATSTSMETGRKSGQYRPTLKYRRTTTRTSVRHPMIRHYSDAHLVEDGSDFDLHKPSNAEVQLINRNYCENKYRQILNTIALHGVQVYAELYYMFYILIMQLIP